MLAPNFDRILTLSHQNKADVQATLTIIATIYFKQVEGKYPDNLELLIEKGYLKELPIDPYSDKPLIYKKTEDGFILYSISEDFIDNGGKHKYSELNKPIPWPQDDGDAVFWPVERSSGKK